MIRPRRVARRLLTAAVTTAALATTVVATSGGAEAAPAAGRSTPVTAAARTGVPSTNLCGAGYALVWSAPVVNGTGTTVAGSADLYWNNASGLNCLVVRATGRFYGATGQTIYAYLSLDNAVDAVSDYGQYRYYAGPIYISARNKCVTVGADITTTSEGYSAGGYHLACG